MFNNTGFVNDESGSVDSCESFAVQDFLSPNSVFLNNLEIRVGNQWIGQFVKRSKLLVLVMIVGANTDYPIALFEKDGMVVPQITNLSGAGWGHISGVEKENYFFAGVVT